MIDGANLSHQGCRTWHPRGIRRLWAWTWASPVWQPTTTSTTHTYLHQAVAGNSEWAHDSACVEWGTPWSGSPVAPLAAGHEHVLLKLSGNSSADLFWAKDLFDIDDWLHTTKLKFGMLHCPSIRRLCMPHSSWEVQQGFGGHHIPQHFQLITTWHGMSSVLHSMVTTCQWAQCAPSLLNF
jgi:hypothetical protein